MCDTPSSQDAFRHQIWNSYLKEYRRYAPDTMQFLEIRSGQVQGHSDPIMVRDTSPSQDALTHHICQICSHTRYAPNRIILITIRVQGQGHSDPKMVCDTLPSQDASHT